MTRRRCAGATLHNAATTSTNRAYQPHRPGYHWEPAKQPHDDTDDGDDFLQRIVHGSCQGVPGCQGETLSCHIIEQLDVLTVRRSRVFYSNSRRNISVVSVLILGLLTRNVHSYVGLCFVSPFDLGVGSELAALPPPDGVFVALS